MWIRPLADAAPSHGAKAFGLARLIAAGVRVPDGFVLDARAFREIAAIDLTDGLTAGLTEGLTDGLGGDPAAIGDALDAAAHRIQRAELPAELDRDVRECASALGRLAVRSSASLEDGDQGAAAGVFSSVTDVAPADVWSAIRAVWLSALTPLAAAYARRRGAAISIAVILQRFVPGPRVTVYTRPVGASEPSRAGEPGDELWIQRDGALERVRRIVAVDRPEAMLALAAEAAIGAARGADVELVLEATPEGTRPWVVQARPILHPVRRRRPAPPPIVLAPLVRDGRRWTWDIAHNPDPLSPAQSGLVEQVDRAGVRDGWAAYALRVCGGYLYTTPSATPQAPAPPADRAELAARIAAIEARFTLADAADVPAAVERYVAFMRIWSSELSPLVAAARGQIIERLARAGHAPERIPALAASLIGARRVLRDPVMAPAWDVAVPTFAETDARGRKVAGGADDHTGEREVAGQPDDFARSATALPAGPAGIAGIDRGDVELARAAADAGELDDLWFARAQWLVRRALLERGRELALRDDDIFWLPLDEVITLRTLDPDDAHRRASAARAAHARAAEWDMPRVVHGDATPAEPAIDQKGAGPLPAGGAGRAPPPRLASLVDRKAAELRGVGEGPRVVGRVVHLASLSRASDLRSSHARVGRGAVVVTRAITPALAMFVEGCAALVSETGGLLDHGAALARELGIPCVVGCAGAWAQLTDGMLVSVDGDAGLVSLAQEA
jgi:phosphohistidine swiveling domain-containing protein